VLWVHVQKCGRCYVFVNPKSIHIFPPSQTYTANLREYTTAEDYSTLAIYGGGMISISKPWDIAWVGSCRSCAKVWQIAMFLSNSIC
jgi:hypothetical protein